MLVKQILHNQIAVQKLQKPQFFLQFFFLIKSEIHILENEEVILPNLKRKLQQINRNENLLYEAIINDVALLTAELSTMSRVQISILFTSRSPVVSPSV